MNNQNIDKVIEVWKDFFLKNLNKPLLNNQSLWHNIIEGEPKEKIIDLMLRVHSHCPMPIEPYIKLLQNVNINRLHGLQVLMSNTMDITSQPQECGMITADDNKELFSGIIVKPNPGFFRHIVTYSTKVKDLFIITDDISDFYTIEFVEDLKSIPELNESLSVYNFKQWQEPNIESNLTLH